MAPFPLLHPLPPLTRTPHHNYHSHAVYLIAIPTLDLAPILIPSAQNPIPLTPGLGALAETQWDLLPQRHAFIKTAARLATPTHFLGILCVNPHLIDHLPPHLSRIITLYKATTTRQARQLGHSPTHSLWNRGFADTLITDRSHLAEITAQIQHHAGKIARIRARCNR